MMKAKELLLQEIEGTSDELLDEVLDFLRFLKARPEKLNRAETNTELLERIEYL